MITQNYIDFFKNLNHDIYNKNTQNVIKAYDVGFANIQSYYHNSQLPSIDTLESHFDIEVEFNLLYDQLQYRHTFKQRVGKLEEYEESYYMHQKLFNMILNEDLLQRIYLSKQWIWDIVDSFVYQFIGYRCFLVTSKEIMEPKDSVWMPTSIFIMMMDLIDNSNRSKMKNEYSKSLQYSMVKAFGYFSAVQSLKLHVLFGDYITALKFVENFDVDAEALYYMVSSCKLTLYYYSAFAYMMVREYQQSIKNCLAFFSFVYSKDLVETVEVVAQIQLFDPKVKAILAICSVLYPCRLDDNINNQLREVLGDKIHKLNNGDLETYKLCLYDAYPDLTPFNLDQTPDYVINVFIEEIQQCLMLPLLRNYIKYYTTLRLDKISSLLHIDLNMSKTQLMLYKQKMKEIKSASTLEEYAAPSDSLTLAPQADFDFCIDRDDTIITFDNKVERKLGEYLIKQIIKFDEISKNVKRLKNY